MRLHNSRFLGALSFSALLFAGLTQAVFAETHTVEMKKYKFMPEEITIKVGDTIRWLNTERRQYHTIWFKDAGEEESVEYYPDESYEKTFDTEGDFPYICGPHHEDYDMRGVVHVTP